MTSKGARIIDHHHAEKRPFLTVVKWPQGWSREDVARLLFEASGLDELTLRLRLGVAPPTIVGTLASVDARGAVNALVKNRGDAFTATLDELAALGPTLKIKDLRLEHGIIVVDLWRGPSKTIQREDVQILVRAQLHSIQNKRYLPPSILSTRVYPGGVGIGSAGTGASAPLLLGAYGLAVGFGAAYSAESLTGFAGAVHNVKTSDKLDIHTKDGKVYQIDGDKFGYSALGELRGHSDKANMDAMCELLAHVAPDEIVDPYFPLWTPPPGHQRLRLKNMKINNDDPAFAFYSRWAALLYRHVLGQSTNAN